MKLENVQNIVGRWGLGDQKNTVVEAIMGVYRVWGNFNEERNKRETRSCTEKWRN